MQEEKSHNLNKNDYNQLIKFALLEDLGGCIDLNLDITSAWTLPKDLQAEAKIISRQDGISAGIEGAKSTFGYL